MRVEIPGRGIVEFPDSMGSDAVTEAIQQMTAEERPPGEPTGKKPSFLQALGQSAQERLGELGQLPGDLLQSVKNVGTELSDKNLPLRMAPMTVPGAGPLTTTAMNLGTEGLAQANEGEFRPGRLAMAALPAFLSGGARLARAADRTATRLLPSKFAGAQQEALDAARKLTQGLTPDTQALYQQAGQAAATAPPLDLNNTGRVLGQMRTQQMTAPPLSNLGTAEREFTEKLGPLDTRPSMPLPEADSYMRELTKVIKGREPAKDAAKLVQGAMVKDFEQAAAGGNQGADLMRKAAEGYKSGMGASRLEDMVTKASPPLTGAGPALNIRALSKMIRNDKELPRLLGTPGMAQVGGFLDQYRGLPPDSASTLASVLKGIGGGSGGGLVGGAIGGPVGAMIGSAAGAIGPEYFQNLMRVGSNPPGLNQLLTLIAQATRAVR